MCAPAPPVKVCGQDPETIYSLNRQTPGIQFEDLRSGQSVRVEVTQKFLQVWHAVILRDR